MDIKVSPVEGQKVIQIQAYVVPEISTIQKGHVELAKGEYPHLKDLWFSDVCKGLDELEMDVLVGTDYLWNFQKERTIRGILIRPVSNLPMVSKSAEKAVVGQLFRHCSDNAPLPVHQSPYHQFHSTEMALLEV